MCTLFAFWNHLHQLLTFSHGGPKIIMIHTFHIYLTIFKKYIYIYIQSSKIIRLNSSRRNQNNWRISLFHIFLHGSSFNSYIASVCPCLSLNYVLKHAWLWLWLESHLISPLSPPGQVMLLLSQLYLDKIYFYIYNKIENIKIYAEKRRQGIC